MHLNLTLRSCRIQKKLFESYDLENIKLYYELIEKANIFLTTSYKERRNFQK